MSVSYIFAGMQEFLAPQGDIECTVDPSTAIDVALMTAAAPFGTDGSLPTLGETLTQVHHTRHRLEQQSHIQVVLNRRDLGQSSKIRVVLGLQCPPLGNPRDIARELSGGRVSASSTRSGTKA